MAKVKLKRALLVDKRFYPVGVQDIPDERLKHPHFARYIKLDLVVAPDNAELETIENAGERAKRLHEKEKLLAAKKKELLKTAETPAADATDSSSASEDGKKKSKKG